MSKSLAVIKHELLCAKRERLPQVLLIVFLAMIAVSSFIGWATNHTVTNVYNEVYRQGYTTAPNPFAGVSSLYYVRNTAIYIVLIGALLAIVLGTQSAIRDKKAQVTELILSRPHKISAYLGAKLSGIAIWLLCILAVSAVINWLSIGLIIGHILGFADSFKLTFFYILAWIFLLPFASLGLISGLYARRETSAFLVPIVIWSLFIFVLPQLGTAEHPVSLLNPVPAQATAHGAFFDVNKYIFGPISISEHFKNASSSLLNNGEPSGSPIVSWLVVSSFALGSSVILITTKRSRLREPINE